MSATPSWKPSVLSTFGSNVPASVNVARASPASAPRSSRSRAEERSPDLMKSSARWRMEANSSRSSCRVTKSGIVLFGADGGARVGATGSDGAGATAVKVETGSSLGSDRLLGSCRFPDSCAAFAETPVCLSDSRVLGNCSARSVATEVPRKPARTRSLLSSRRALGIDTTTQTMTAAKPKMPTAGSRDCPVRSAVRLGLWWFRNPFRIKCQSTLYLCDRPITPGIREERCRDPSSLPPGRMARSAQGLAPGPVAVRT